MAYNSIRLPQDLTVYYKHFFPIKPFTKWLSYGTNNRDYLSHRELAFILAGDVHIRYRSFHDEHSLYKALTSTNPEKLDVGAVYNHEPVNHKRHTDYQAVERELVFDIDLTDYDPIRNCCKDATVCQKCWKFMVLAVKILDFLLEDMYGFEARMWVFSGRRGVHCWVGDREARKLTNSERSAIATRFNLFKKNGRCEVTEYQPKCTKVPCFVQDAFDIAMKDGIFEQMCYEQGWLEDGSLILEYPYISELLTKTLNEEVFPNYTTPQERWHMLRGIFDPAYREKLDPKDGLRDIHLQNRDRYAFIYFVLQRCYPRLDVNVSTGTNHLLKSPFCIHPKTGNVAVPLNLSTIADFDVSKCPRIDDVVGELDGLLSEKTKDNEENEDAKNRKYLAYKHGILAPYVETFEQFIKACNS